MGQRCEPDRICVDGKRSSATGRPGRATRRGFDLLTGVAPPQEYVARGMKALF